MSGAVRPLARYQRPTAWMNRTGEIEALLGASGLSFPRGETPSPITRSVGSTAFSVSYDRASRAPACAADATAPPGPNNGRQNAG